jgi:hypothetical protein
VKSAEQQKNKEVRKINEKNEKEKEKGGRRKKTQRRTFIIQINTLHEYRPFAHCHQLQLGVSNFWLRKDFKNHL